MYQILLVEDDKSIREVIADYMDEKGKDTMRLTLAEAEEPARAHSNARHLT